MGEAIIKVSSDGQPDHFYKVEKGSIRKVRCPVKVPNGNWGAPALTAGVIKRGLPWGCLGSDTGTEPFKIAFLKDPVWHKTREAESMYGGRRRLATHPPFAQLARELGVMD